MSVLVGLLPCFGCFGLCVGLSGLGLLLGSVTLSVGLVLLSLALTLQFIVADDRTDRLLRLALHSFEGAHAPFSTAESSWSAMGGSFVSGNWGVPVRATAKPALPEFASGENAAQERCPGLAGVDEQDVTAIAWRNRLNWPVHAG